MLFLILTVQYFETVLFIWLITWTLLYEQYKGLNNLLWFMQSIWVIVSNFVSDVYNKYVGSVIYNKSWIESIWSMNLI